MNVLQINKFHFLKGGAEKYYFELSSMLEGGGDRVTHFAMKSPLNLPSDFSDFFVSELDFDSLPTILDRVSAAGRIIYSFEARKNLEKLLSVSSPDLAHLHNIYHQLSPSILAALEGFGVPAVLTAHDYKLVCPNYLLYNEDRVCERCVGGKYYNALFARCMRRSLLSGITLTIEAYLHRFLKSYEKLRMVIAPSRFLMEKLAESGFPREKLVHIPNFVYSIPGRAAPAEGHYIAYLGRLSREKGLATLIRAVSHLEAAELRIAGSGPLKEDLEKLTRRLGADNVRFVGHLKTEDVGEFIENSRFAVVPSEYYENCPLSILETMALGKPVIGAAIGGIPELIREKEDGLLFEAGNETDLREKMLELWLDPERTSRMGKQAREKIIAEYNRDIHYRRILQIYEKVLK